jgi:hypothetical protein
MMRDEYPPINGWNGIIYNNEHASLHQDFLAMTVRVYRMCSEHGAIVRTLRNHLVSSTSHSMSSEPIIHKPLILPRDSASEHPRSSISG